MASLYSYKYEPQEITNSEDEHYDEIKFIIVDKKKEEKHSEVVK